MAVTQITYKLVKAPASRGGMWEWYAVAKGHIRADPDIRPDIPADHIYVAQHPTEAGALAIGRARGWCK